MSFSGLAVSVVWALIVIGNSKKIKQLIDIKGVQIHFINKKIKFFIIDLKFNDLE